MFRTRFRGSVIQIAFGFRHGYFIFDSLVALSANPQVFGNLLKTGHDIYIRHVDVQQQQSLLLPGTFTYTE